MHLHVILPLWGCIVRDVAFTLLFNCLFKIYSFHSLLHLHLNYSERKDTGTVLMSNTCFFFSQQLAWLLLMDDYVYNINEMATSKYEREALTFSFNPCKCCCSDETNRRSCLKCLARSLISQGREFIIKLSSIINLKINIFYLDIKTKCTKQTKCTYLQ